MASQKKKVRVISQAKKTSKDGKKKTASDGISKARKSLEDAREVKAQREARKKELQKSLAAASEEEAKAMKMEIDTIEDELQQTEQKLQAAQAEEARFKKDEEDADNEDEYSDMEVDDDNDPDKPKPSTESMDPAEFAAKLMKGLSISDRTQAIDLTQDIQLRNTQAVTCYKSGFGKPVIVVDCEIPNALIYRIRKDIMVPDGTPNLMRWRRGGKWKDVKAEVKWTSRDIKDILGIAIEVPLGYNGKPEDLVQPIRRLSKKEKERLIKKGKPIPKEPKQPDVQLLVEWWKGIIAEGETEKRVTSWESRSSCRQIWRKKGVADACLLDVATKKEAAYRRAGGRHSTEERSLSPIRIPRGTPGVGDDLYSDESGTEDEEEEEEQKKKERKKKERKKGKKEEEDEEEEDEDEDEEDEEEKKKKKEKKEEEEKKKKQKGGFDASDYKAASDQFELRFRARKGIAADVELTPIQEGDLIEAFEYVWAKRQGEKRGSKL
jgi:hypothetical protein